MPRQGEGQAQAQGSDGKHEQQQGDQHQQQAPCPWPAVAQQGCGAHDRQALHQAEGCDVENRSKHDRTAGAQGRHQQPVEEAKLPIKHHRQAGIEGRAEGGENNHACSEEASVTDATRQQTRRGLGKQGPKQHQPDQRLQHPGHQGGGSALQLHKQAAGEGEGFLADLGQG